MKGGSLNWNVRDRQVTPMNITGLQKMTLLDFPGRVACTVFLQGCNFRCPFCHNSDLLGAEGPQRIPVDTLLGFLKKRVGLLDGVCITGGEPTLQPDLPELLQSIKAMGYAVKLDTNGYRPEVLRRLAEAGLVDYVAMDIKNCPELYPQTTGLLRFSQEKIEESIRFLMYGSLPFEFRTTVAAEFHNAESIVKMGQWLRSLAPDRKVPRLFLQPFADRDSVLKPGLHTPSEADLQVFSGLLAPYAETVEIRG